jgi:hypothetical protein
LVFGSPSFGTFFFVFDVGGNLFKIGLSPI